MRIALLFLISAVAGAQTVKIGSGVKLSGVLISGACSGDAAITRTLPPGFPTLPMMPTCVRAPGNVVVDKTVDQAFLAKYPATASGSYLFWDPVAGNDSTCAVNSTNGCLTWFKSVMNLTAPNVYVKNAPGTPIVLSGATPFRYGHTDAGSASGTIAKRLVCMNPPCILRFFGDTIATNTWAAVGGHADVYSTTIASAVAGTSGSVNSVLYQDGTVDAPYVDSDGVSYPFIDTWAHSYPSRVPTAFANVWSAVTNYIVGNFVFDVFRGTVYQCIAPNVNHSPPNATYWILAPSTGFSNSTDYAGVNTLDAMTNGQYYSTTDHILYVKLNGADLTNPTVAARIRANYLGIGGATEIDINGTQLELVGFYLDGIFINSQQQLVSGTYYSGETWVQDTTIFGAEGAGFTLIGADLYSYNNEIYAGQTPAGTSNIHSGIGIDSAQPTPHNPVLELVNTTLAKSFDPDMWATVTLPQSISHGETSHSGYQINIGSINETDDGSEFSAASVDANLAYQTWWVGSIARNLTPANLSNQIGYSAANFAAGTELIWMDTSTSYNIPMPAFFANGVVCKTFDVTVTITYLNNSPCTTYTPSAP